MQLDATVCVRKTLSKIYLRRVFTTPVPFVCSVGLQHSRLRPPLTGTLVPDHGVPICHSVLTPRSTAYGHDINKVCSLRGASSGCASTSTTATTPTDFLGERIQHIDVKACDALSLLLFAWT